MMGRTKLWSLRRPAGNVIYKIPWWPQHPPNCPFLELQFHISLMFLFSFPTPVHYHIPFNRPLSHLLSMSLSLCSCCNNKLNIKYSHSLCLFNVPRTSPNIFQIVSVTLRVLRPSPPKSPHSSEIKHPGLFQFPLLLQPICIFSSLKIGKLRHWFCRNVNLIVLFS